ncbi:MAG: hypothetical protein ACK5E6_12945 [Cyanobacteriota bacterium]
MITEGRRRGEAPLVMATSAGTGSLSALLSRDGSHQTDQSMIWKVPGDDNNDA